MKSLVLKASRLIVSQKYMNIVMLVLGFGVGQGSIFLSNTYLFWHHEYQIIANFGSVNALLTLILFIGDWGGATYLAKESLMGGGHVRANEHYAALSALRLLLALVYVGIVVAIWHGEDGFFASYLIASAVSVVAWAFNAVGLLDGSARSGVAGLSQAIPLFSVAVAMPACAGLQPATAGLVLGWIYSAAVCVAVLTQLWFARPSFDALRRGLTVRNFISISAQSTPYMLTPLPGHALFRGQVYLANAFLPAQAVALFIYARQIIGIGYQAPAFYLRADLREFSEWLRSVHPSAFLVLFRAGAVRIAAVLMLAVIAAAQVLGSLRPELATVLTVYAVAVLTLTSSSVLQRVYLLVGRAQITVVILATTSVAGILYGYAFIGTQMVYALVFAEVLTHLAQILWLIGAWRRNQPPAPA